MQPAARLREGLESVVERPTSAGDSNGTHTVQGHRLGQGKTPINTPLPEMTPEDGFGYILSG